MSNRIDSTSDERTANNVVRHEYRTLSDEEKAKIGAVKDAGAQLIRQIDETSPFGRSERMTLAVHKVEEAVFWAVKDLTE